ncbi:metallophosphoesterase family protein [Halanaerobium saccharolyticum]|jgi:predicted MPP superfamily phosphohydrolase|uniref:Putative phosphodiesterase n=2 Tax=Halanaerobium saccharolyticum TaxID=43595 RepID=A0A2T5RJ27_9FIRM|nr:metallophosphoesterase [Halanaerobium saccharolyticum]PTV98477.1 putative phosphodiesterase [Halanaerobium saccharolyticum]TDQ06134.1 putative phosphodiesterase [Halanaerobium saccharolyticum]
MTSVIRKVFNNFSSGLSDFKNRYKLPEEFHSSQELKIMHISDTPESIYSHIYKMLNYSQPDVIIHTGDLVDNLKLEDAGSEMIPLYQKKSAEFISNLEKLTSARIIYVPGNHDDLSIIKDNTKRSEVVAEGTIIDLDGVKIGLAHYPENLPQTADINLFGHNKQSEFESENKYLNGILNINYLLLPSKTDYKVNYPWTVDQGRQYKRFNMI